MAAPQEIHLTAGGARAKAAGKPRRRRIDAARRAGPANHGAAGLGHAQGLFARSCLHRLLHPRPRQRCPRQAHRHRRPRQPCHRYCRHRHFPVRRRRRPRCHRPRPRRHHHRPRPRRHGPQYATLSLAATVAAVAFAFAFAFAAAAQPAQSASAALATVEGHAAPLIRSRLIETVRSVCGTPWVSLRFWIKAPQKRQISRGAAAPHPAVGHTQRFSQYQLFLMHLLGARLPLTTESPTTHVLCCPTSCSYRSVCGTDAACRLQF